MKLEFSDELIHAFNKMQRIYVLDDESMLTIDEVKNTIKVLLEIFNDLQEVQNLNYEKKVNENIKRNEKYLSNTELFINEDLNYQKLLMNLIVLMKKITMVFFS